jgi:multidrug resistance efflux pump
LGLGLLALATWALVPLLLHVRSRQAVINAPVLTVCSPINGTVTFLPAATLARSASEGSGGKEGAKTPLLEVTNALADGDRLATLEGEKALVEAQIESHRLQLAQLAGLQKSLAQTAEKYGVARLRTLELDRDAAAAWLESVQATARQRGLETKILSRLEASHSVSRQDSAATQFAAEAAHYAVVQAQKNVENLEEQIRALRQGVHVGPGDGRNDLPYSTQRIHEISLRMEEIRAALREDEAKLAQLGRRVKEEEERFALQSRFTAKASNKWVVWRRYVAQDGAVRAGEPLAAMIDPAEIFVDAVISESDLKRVRPGDGAEVRIMGSDKRWKAEVTQVVGRTLPWPDRLLAADAAPTLNGEAHALLRFREPISQGAGAASLPLGLPAEVTFRP